MKYSLANPLMSEEDGIFVNMRSKYNHLYEEEAPTIALVNGTVISIGYDGIIPICFSKETYS